MTNTEKLYKLNYVNKYTHGVIIKKYVFMLKISDKRKNDTYIIISNNNIIFTYYGIKIIHNSESKYDT